MHGLVNAAKIIDVLDSLTERERRVLSLRFGLVDGYSRTLEEVGKQFKVTRERIRQLHGFFDAEQIDNAQNLLKVAATTRAPGVPAGGPLGSGSLPGGLGFPMPKL